MNANELFPKVLKIGIQPNQYLLEVDENENNQTVISGGINGFLLLDLSIRIGFAYELYFPKDKDFGYINSKGEWTGILGMLDRGEVDLAFATFIFNEDRYNGFHMIPFTVHEIAYATNMPQFQKAESRFEQPFQTEVWISCVLAYVLITFMLWIVKHSPLSQRKHKISTFDEPFVKNKPRISSEPKKYKRLLRKQQCKVHKIYPENFYQNRKKTFQNPNTLKTSYSLLYISNAALEALKIAFRQNLNLNKIKHSPEKVVLGTWMIASMLLTYSYSGNLLSYMTLPPLSQPIKTVEQLANAVNTRNFKVYTDKNKAILEVIRKNSALKGLVDKMNEKNWFYNIKVDGFPETFAIDTAIIAILTQLKIGYGVKPFATKFISDDMISEVPAGLAVRKTFCCTTELRWHLNRIVETGVYKTYLDRILFITGLNRTLEKEESPFKKLSIHDFKSMFYFLAFGLTMSGIVLFLEALSVTKFKGKLALKKQKIECFFRWS